MDTPQAAPVNHISLCAGYGGIDLGLSRVIRGLRTVAFSEIEAFACANLVAKMEAGLLDAAPIWSNLKTFGWRRFRGRVGILSGGFPCQPFSAAGKRGGDEDPRHLFPYILRGITECQPDLVFLENVEGIISAKLKGSDWRDPAGTPVLLHVLRELERIHYRATAGVFSSAEIGASHQRKRVFILAMADEHYSRLSRRGRLGDIHVSEGREAEERCATTSGVDDQQWNSTQSIVADTLHDGHSPAERPSGARPSGARPSENQGWLRQSAGVGSPQRNVLLRPKPPGPDQWWWEPARVIQSFTRIANRHSRFVADARRGECDGREDGAGSERAAQSVAGETGAARNDTYPTSVANATDSGREQRRDGESPALQGERSKRTREQARPESTGELSGRLEGLGGSVGDPTLMQCDGGDNHPRVSLGQEPLSQLGNAGGSKHVANHSSNGWGERRSQSSGKQGRSDVAQCSQSTVEDSNGKGPLDVKQPPDGWGTGTASQSSDQVSAREVESSLGRDPDGSPCGLDYAELSTTVDSRTDELRLLGNGVDPDVVAKAFVTLYNRLNP